MLDRERVAREGYDRLSGRRIDGYGLQVAVTLILPASGDVERRFRVVPQSLVKMESVLAAASVQRDEPRSLHALRTAGRAVVEQGVDPGSPQQRVLCQVFRVIFMKTGLPSFRLPEQAVRAASASRIALLFDLPRFTVADARTELVPPRPKLAEPDFEVFRAAFVPADVLRPYDQVGDLVQFSVLSVRT